MIARAFLALAAELVLLVEAMTKPKRAAKKAGKRIPSDVAAEIADLRERIDALSKRLA